MIEENWLRKVLLEDFMTCKQVAELAGCSHGLVSIYAKKYGINIKDRNKPSKEELYDMYVTKRLPVKDIAKKHKMGLQSVKDLIRKYGMEVKKPGSNQYTEITYADVKNHFEKEGYNLISTEYKNTSTHLEFICPRGHRSKMVYSSFKIGKRCKKCAVEKTSSKQRHTYEYIKDFFEKKGCTLLSETYINSNQKLDYICYCGEKASMRFVNFQRGYGCKNCKRLKFLGEKNHNYNPNLTDEDRLEIGRYEERYKGFRKSVYRRDGYKCVVCGSGKSNTLVAHHLDSYTNFPEKRTDVNNAVTLCQSCHKDFHGMYGYKNNTKEQFEEYISEKAHHLST